MKFLLLLNLIKVLDSSNRHWLLFVFSFVFTLGYSQEDIRVMKDSLLFAYEVKNNIKKRELTDLYFIIHQNHQFKKIKKHITNIRVRYLEMACNKETYASGIYEIELSEKVALDHFYKDFHPIKITPISKAPISYYVFNKDDKNIIIAGIYGSFLHFEKDTIIHQIDSKNILTVLKDYLLKKNTIFVH